MTEHMLAQGEEDTRCNLGIVVTVECADHIANGCHSDHHATQDKQQAEIFRQKDVVNQNLGKNWPQQTEDCPKERQTKNKNQPSDKGRDKGQQATEAGERCSQRSRHRVVQCEV